MQFAAGYFSIVKRELTMADKYMFKQRANQIMSSRIYHHPMMKVLKRFVSNCFDF